MNEWKLVVYLGWRRRVNVRKAWRTCFRLSIVASSIKLPSLSNFGGGWNAFTLKWGLLTQWRSRKTPTVIVPHQKFLRRWWLQQAYLPMHLGLLMPNRGADSQCSRGKILIKMHGGPKSWVSISQLFLKIPLLL